MRLKEAIEVSTVFLADEGAYVTTAEIESIQLGIEALEEVNRLRQAGSIEVKDPLPGETEE